MKSSNPLKSIRLTDGKFADRLSMKYGWVVGQATNRSGMVHVEPSGARKAAFRARPIQISISRTYPVMPLHVKLTYIHTQLNRIIHQNSDFHRINGTIPASIIRQYKQVTVQLKEGSKQVDQLSPRGKLQVENALQSGAPVRIPAVSQVDLISAKQEIVIPINRIRLPLHLQAIVDTLQTVKQQLDTVQGMPLAIALPILIRSQSPSRMLQRQKVQKAVTVPLSIRQHADFVESARTLERIQHSSHPSRLVENRNLKPRHEVVTNETILTNHIRTTNQTSELNESSEKRQVANVVRRQRNETNQMSNVVNRTNN
ncbi:hypothetical protein BK133_17680, partial [Paenibacillus sp. FSL H8-0548]